VPDPAAADLLAFLDALPVPVFSYDPAGRHTYVNAAVTRMVGYAPDQLLGKTMAEVGYPPNIAVEYAAAVRAVAETGEPHAQRLTVPTPGGEAVVEIRPGRRAGPRGAGEVVGAGVDITARVAAEAALRESEARYRQVVEDQTEVVCRFRPDGTFTFVSDVYCRVFGKRAGDLVGSRWQPVVHPDDVPGVEARLAAMSAANPVVVIENRVTDGAGRVRWMEFVNRGFYAPDGTLAEVQAVGRDVTARREAEDARRDAERRLEAFFDTAPVVAWMKDEAGRYVYLSPSYHRRFRAAGWLGRTDADLWPAAVARAFRENDLRVLAGGRPEQVSETAPDPGGDTRTWLNTKFPFVDARGARHVGGVGVDVTDWVRAEALRRQAEADLRAGEEQREQERRMLQSQKLESLGVLAGGIAHDFNNLLTAVLGYASLARLDVAGRDYSALDEYLDKIERAGHRAADLCRQMLAYAGRGQFAVRPTPLNPLVEEMGGLLAASVSKKAVLRFNLDPAGPVVDCDATQIRQVVMNLITNASDAVEDRSGVVTVTTGVVDADAAYLREVSADDLPPRRYAYLEVSDTGCGMTDEVKARLFEPFFTTKFTGRGLGLSAVLGIVRGHGGAVKVYTQVGKGTTFKVLLPTTDDAPPADPGPDEADRPFGRGRLVLVVDDEEDVRVLARKLLTRAGFAVEVAADGRAGVDAFRARPDDFALVLLDLTMPRLDGAAAFRELRQVRRGVRVILASGYAADEATVGFEGKGLAGFVRKPFRSQELLAAVRAAVGP
jgi:PAS domain S-box-containing protein